MASSITSTRSLELTVCRDGPQAFKSANPFIPNYCDMDQIPGQRQHLVSSWLVVSPKLPGLWLYRPLSLPWSLCVCLPTHGKIVTILDRDTLGHVVDLVDAHQPLGEFKHVVSQGNDDKLRVLGALLDVAGHNRHLRRMLAPATNSRGQEDLHCGNPTRRQSRP